MKTIVTGLLAASLLLPSILLAQRPNAQRSTSQRSSTDLTAKKDVPSTPVLAPLGVGTAFNASLTDPLDTRRSRPGDVVTADVAEDVAYERTIIFPRGTKILGHIVRATAGGRGRAGSALFVQFDKAVLSSGEEVLLNAGIQALAATSVPPLSDIDSNRPGELAQSHRSSSEPYSEPVSESATSASAAVLSTDYTKPRGGFVSPLSLAPKAQGELNSDGFFSPDSVGAFGRPDLKVYTPTSQGSHGTVLLSSKKNMRLETGTRLLLVIQPPPSAEPDALENIDLSDVSPKP